MALTGFLVKHQCAPTSGDALRLLVADYPVVSSNFLITTMGASFTAPSSFSQQFRSFRLDATTIYTYTKTFTLPACDPALPVDVGIVPFDPVVAGVFWSTAMVFVLGCWLLAKNAGIIVNAIRRF